MNNQYTNSKNEVKEVSTMNSFELVNGIIKYAKISNGTSYSEAIEDINRAIVNVSLLKEELLKRLDNREVNI